MKKLKCRVIRQKPIDVSEECTAYTFMVKEYAKQEYNKIIKQNGAEMPISLCYAYISLLVQVAAAVYIVRQAGTQRDN
jgi:hypothetical protein